jgi:hypothetical protein
MTLPLSGRVLKSCVIVIGRVVMLISGRTSPLFIAAFPHGAAIRAIKRTIPTKLETRVFIV